MAPDNSTLPPFAPYPESVWRSRILPTEWQACLDAWISISSAHLELSTSDFLRISARDESIPLFLSSYAAETVMAHPSQSSANASRIFTLKKQCYLLSYRLLNADSPLESLFEWSFLADLCNIYGQRQGSKLASQAWKKHSSRLEISLGQIKTILVKDLEAGLKGDLRRAEASLKRLNPLLHASPEAAAFFLAGSDFLDALISCYRLMNPPLRNAIISTTYLCLVGLTEGQKSTFSFLVDQLYSLQVAAETHKMGPTNVNDSLVAELVTCTPILKQLQQRIDASGSGFSRANSVLTNLKSFKKSNEIRSLRSNANKGKDAVKENSLGQVSQVHLQRMSLITQVQDIFADFGSGFISKLLDEYNDDPEKVISHLLEDSLPAVFQNADQSEELPLPVRSQENLAPNLAPHSGPYQLPIRRNIFDGDELDRLTVNPSRLHFGRKITDKISDELLEDKSAAPSKAIILSALAAFDSDDDERDDTYDVEDVGGTVDTANPEEDLESAHDETLFRVYRATPAIFSRDAATRRSHGRLELKQATGMTDEIIEGWGLMLSRDARKLKTLETKLEGLEGGRLELPSTAWRSSPAESGTDDSELGGSSRGRGAFRGRVRAKGRGRRAGNVAEPTGEKNTEVARHRKEANKASRANHNRRDQRAKKMARGGFME